MIFNLKEVEHISVIAAGIYLYLKDNKKEVATGGPSTLKLLKFAVL